MAVYLAPTFGVGYQGFVTSNVPNAGGQVWTYLAGSSTLAATYTNNSGSIAQSNPMLLDSTGRIPSGGEVWLTGGQTYKFVVQDAYGNTLGTYDNLIGIGDPSPINTTAINQSSTGNFYLGNGARINKINDRLFVGGATVNDGAYPNVSKDWLASFQGSYVGGSNPSTVSGVMNVLTDPSNGNSAEAIIGGAQSVLFTGAGASAIGTQGYGINNNSTYKTYAWGFYGEAHRINNTVGSVWGMELDVTQYGSLAPVDPYGSETGVAGQLAIALQLSCGAGHSATGQFNASSPLVITANPMPFDKGIVVTNGSIGSSNMALVMAQNHQIQWFAALNTPTTAIQSTATTAAGTHLLSFQQGGTFFENNSDFSTCFGINTATGQANYLYVSPATTTNAPSLQAIGADTNVDMLLSCKGSGVVRFGTYTAGVVTQAGYITVKDSGGTTRRLLVG